MASMLSRRFNTILLLLVLLVVISALASRVWGGPLDPPAPPSSTQASLIYQPASCAGFPIVLSAPGSYRLAGNITGCASKYGILVSADDVSLDLAGFSVIGVASSLDGIRKSSGAVFTLTNGDVFGWAQDGVNLTGSAAGRVENVIAAGNANGIKLGQSSSLSHSTASANQFDGIDVNGAGDTVSECTVVNNGNSGVYIAGNGAVVDRCEVGSNGSVGIAEVVAQSTRVVGNHVYNNANDGISVQGDCTIEDNDAERNAGNGIHLTGGRCSITGNTATANGQGISVDGVSSRVDSNHAANNNQYGIIVSPAPSLQPNIIIRNSAGFNQINNYSIAAGNDAGPIGQAATASSPWANIYD